jgi:glycine/serine hydroxymethyltransferase
LGHELGEQIEEAIECATGRESAHLGRKHGFKESGIQIGRDAITNGGLGILELREESILFGRPLGTMERPRARMSSPVRPLTT